MSLSIEIRKPEYSGLTDEQALAALQALTVTEGVMLPATTVNQLFAKLDLTGVIQDIAATHDHKFRHKMASVILSIGGNHPFNFIEGTTAGDGNLAMLDDMIADLPNLAAKLLQFRGTVYHLANRRRPFAGVTLADVVAARAIQLDGQWHELDVTDGRTLLVRLRAAAPEQTYIVVQAQDQYGNGTVSDWYHATAVHGLSVVREHPAPLPHNGYPRKLRWSCEYLLDVAVSVR